jgi:cytochrome P450
MAREKDLAGKTTEAEEEEEGDDHSDGDGEGNMIEWAEETAKGATYDAALLQMKVSLASIHTTSDLVTQTLFNLCSRPELVDDLRKEIIEVIGQQGWVKPALYQLKLMDSVLKETQRLKPISIGSYFRSH